MKHWYRTAQTEGRTWDGNLYVYNHPVSRAWLIALAVALGGALVYWLLYPSWPGVGGYYPGVIEIDLAVGDRTRREHWSSEAAFLARRQSDPHWERQQRLMAETQRGGYASVASDPTRLRYALAFARLPYRQSCAPCHAADGRGLDGFGTDLIDGEWRRSADYATIEAQVRAVVRGRHGRSAAGQGPQAGVWRVPLTEQQVRALTLYVAKLAP